MAKKIRYALKMNNVDVRSLESLKDNFDLEKVTAYFLNGKLLEWLEDRYYEDEAEKIRNLDKNADNFAQKLCKVFGVEYHNEELDLKATAMLDENLAKLKQLTDDNEILSHAAQVAFSQEDLAYLLDEDATTIYLCGEKFSIPASFENRKYIGILGKPTIKISIKTFGELEANGIAFENVNLPKNLLPPPPPPVVTEIIQGRAEITRHSPTYNREGYYYMDLLEGKITLYSRVRVLRDNREIYDGTVFSLNNGKNDCLRYRKYGNQYEIHFDKEISTFENGDIIEAYVLETSSVTAPKKKVLKETIECWASVGEDQTSKEITLGARNDGSRFYENAKVRILRNNRKIYDGVIFSYYYGDDYYKTYRYYHVIGFNEEITVHKRDIVEAYKVIDV